MYLAGPFHGPAKVMRSRYAGLHKPGRRSPPRRPNLSRARRQNVSRDTF